MMSQPGTFMRRALRLAAKGGRAVVPNPLVGAVIVKNGKVIGQGWHQKFGGPHAEVNAIRSVRRPSDLRGATLYVTLEPCRHWGKTPPCMDLIRKVGIKRVVAGSRDPFQMTNDPMTNDQLNIVFSKGPIARQCRELNKFFFTWVTKKRPYITVKIAMSPDGFVGKIGQRVHITNRAQDRMVHRLRAQHQAILVGVNTVIVDDPRLDVRLVRGQDPLRIILDSRLRIPHGAKVLKDQNYLIATCVKRPPKSLQTWVSPTSKQVNLKALFRELARRGVSSILAEPGPTLYRSLKQAGVIDELIIVIGKKKIGQGIPFFQPL